MDCEPSDRLTILIVAEPLTDMLWGKGSDLLVVGDIVTLVPVFHLRLAERHYILLWSTGSDTASGCKELLASAASAVIPLLGIVLTVEKRIARLLIVISHIEPLPSSRNGCMRVWYPSQHPMSYTEWLTESLKIRLNISALILDDREKFPEYMLHPCILWGVSDIEGLESTGLEICAIWGWTRSMIVEILRIFVRLELNHRETIAERREKGKKIVVCREWGYWIRVKK